jgi:hypothetical protein
MSGFAFPSQNILAASPYLIVHTICRIQQPARPLPPPDPNIQHQSQCDPGANISATNDINVLRDTVDLENQFRISSADRTAPAMMASVRGTFVLLLSDGSKCDIQMYYCPSLADTIIYPQHFTSSAISDSRHNGYCLIDMPGCRRILLSHTNDNGASLIALQKINNPYFVAGSAPGASVHRVSHLATKPQILSDLWHQRLSHPGPTQLSVLANHSTGIPSQLTAGLHPVHYCQACNDGKIRHAPMGPNSDTDPLIPGTRFYLDFGFIRASSSDFGVSTGNRVITSYDGNNAYLLVVCAKTRHTWIFCQASKSPPILIIERFLALNGLNTEPRFLCIDQGGELWRSNQSGEVAAAAGYTMEPTGSYAASKNGKVERPNGTFGAMVRCLIYSAVSSAIFWYSTLVHAVYLKNRLYHKSLCQTPHEA